MTERAALLVAIAMGCGHRAPPSPPPSSPDRWPVPPGWKHEKIPFPLEFAPALGHRGVEELRFPPGFLTPGSPNAWSYTFVWRLEDPGALDATALAGELQGYFRGLLAAVDGDKHRLDPAQITATAVARPAGAFDVSVHVIDTFHDAQAVDVSGTAHRIACGGGAMWTFVLGPAASPIRAELERVAATAACGQRPVD